MTFKNNLKFFLRNFGLDISRYNMSESDDFRLSHFLKSKEIDCVFDIGANEGQYATHLRRIGYNKKIISFEPMKKAYKVLEIKSIKDGNWTAYNYGIGEKEKEVELNISENSYSSSILKILPDHYEAAPESKYISKENISIKRLDNLKEIDIEKLNKIFVKIDTQGYEENVLTGAEKILDKVEGIQMELSLHPLYEGQSLFNELYEKMKKLNYNLWDLQTGFKNIKTGKVYQLDGIFFKN